LIHGYHPLGREDAIAPSCTVHSVSGRSPEKVSAFEIVPPPEARGAEWMYAAYPPT